MTVVATDQTADIIIFTSAPQGISGLVVLNDETGSGLNTFAVNIYINMHLSQSLTLIQHMQTFLIFAFLQYTHKINLPNTQVQYLFITVDVQFSNITQSLCGGLVIF